MNDKYRFADAVGCKYGNVYEVKINIAYETILEK